MRRGPRVELSELFLVLSFSSGDLIRDLDPWQLIAYCMRAGVGVLKRHETMSRFRSSPKAEMVLDEIVGVDEGDVDWAADDTAGLADWLAAQRVGTVRVLDPGFFIDVETPALLTQLDKHPRVRDAVSSLDAAARLDVALLRLGASGSAARSAKQLVPPSANGSLRRSASATDPDSPPTSRAGRSGTRPGSRWTASP